MDTALVLHSPEGEFSQDVTLMTDFIITDFKKSDISIQISMLR